MKMMMKTILKAMFGLYLNQPIHVTLQQLKFVSLALIYFCMMLLWDMWVWFKGQENLPDSWDVAFWAFAGSILGIIWNSIQHIKDKTDQ